MTCIAFKMFLVAISASAITEVQPWWSDGVGTWIGAMSGVVLGGTGALIGGLGGRGKARRFVLTVMIVLISLGAASVSAGIIAWLSSQPRGVFYPLLMVGSITLVIMGLLYPGVRRRFVEIQLRKIQAADS